MSSWTSLTRRLCCRSWMSWWNYFQYSRRLKWYDVVGVDVVVVVGVPVAVVGVVEVVLREMVEVLDLEVLVELFVLDVKVLNLGSPLDKLNVTTTVLVASSRHQLHSQEIPFQKHGDQGILTRR